MLTTTPARGSSPPAKLVARQPSLAFLLFECYDRVRPRWEGPHFSAPAVSLCSPKITQTRSFLQCDVSIGERRGSRGRLGALASHVKNKELGPNSLFALRNWGKGVSGTSSVNKVA